MTRLRSTLLRVLLPVALALPRNVPEDIHPVNERADEAPNVDRAQAVIDIFRTSWDGYYTYAFPHDELHPVSNTFSDSRYV
jgi:mannosyl-oligosaccharide alpha-1,2-mannosidase